MTHLPARTFPQVGDDEPVAGSSAGGGARRGSTVVPSSTEASASVAAVEFTVAGRHGRTTTGGGGRDGSASCLSRPFKSVRAVNVPVIALAGGLGELDEETDRNRGARWAKTVSSSPETRCSGATTHRSPMKSLCPRS